MPDDEPLAQPEHKLANTHQLSLSTFFHLDQIIPTEVISRQPYHDCFQRLKEALWADYLHVSWTAVQQYGHIKQNRDWKRRQATGTVIETPH